MIRRLILCEGPEDIAALRALAVGHFGWTSREMGSANRQALSVGEERAYDLKGDSVTVRLRAIPGAKSGLAQAIGDIVRDNFNDGLTHVATVFDPDIEPESVEFARVHAAIDAARSDWQVTRQQPAPHVARWSFERPRDDRVTVHAIPWRSSGPIVDKLEDAQHLERLECEILAKAFPTLAGVVIRWIDEMRDTHGQAPTWKSAIHLWCALVDPKQSTASFAERVLHQEKEWRTHAKDALAGTHLLEDLQPLLARH